MLEHKKSRRVFEQIRDDSSSLIVLRDSASLFSSSTHTKANSSKLSMRFGFDGELLGSRVYQGTMRSLIRRVIHSRKKEASRLGHSQPIEACCPR
jgi:hypothetical protein